MEYRFRGFDAVGNKGWVYGDLVHNKRVDLTDRVMVGGYEVVPESVGIWTGLKDEVGCPIYEGDIVRCNEFVYQVAYDDKCIASFFLRRDGDMYRHYFGEAMEADECEVIDTMFENKELLKQ
jgi:hypothetical protein